MKPQPTYRRVDIPDGGQHHCGYPNLNDPQVREAFAEVGRSLESGKPPRDYWCQDPAAHLVQAAITAPLL